MPSFAQSKILNFMNNEKEYSLEEIMKGIGYSLYCNSNKHFGVILSRMVKKGILIRVKKGVFKIKPKEKINNEILFN